MSSDATRVVHAGLPAPAQGEPFLPGPTFAAPYHLTGDPSSSPFGYQRDANPTWQRYEAALGALEGAEAVLFASGMAAVSAVVLALGPGDVLVAPADGYPGIRALGREHLAPRGVEVRLVPTDEAAVRAALGEATLVWLETPSNPGLDVVPIASLAEAAHAVGAALAVDNTLATALGQRPLDLGADLVVTSCSKALSGHSASLREASPSRPTSSRLLAPLRGPRSRRATRCTARRTRGVHRGGGSPLASAPGSPARAG